MRKTLIGFVLTFLFASIAWKIYSQEAVMVTTVAVERGPIHEIITATGKVISQHAVSVSSSLSGQITDVRVDEGDVVARGKILARLDDREALAAVSKAKANLNLAREGAAQSLRRLEQVRRLFEVGGEPGRAVQDAEAHWKTSREKQGMAEADLLSAQVLLEKLNVLSPAGGLITSRMAQVGEWAAPGTPLFTLAEPASREIEVKLDSAESAAVAEGQTAILSSDAFPDKSWSERIIHIAPAVAREDGANIIKMRVSLNSTSPLKIGQQVDIKIQSRSKLDALKIPFDAVITRDGKKQVAVIRNGRIQFTSILTGIEDFSQIEIVEGLKGGEQLVLPKGKVFSEGDRVEPLGTVVKK